MVTVSEDKYCTSDNNNQIIFIFYSLSLQFPVPTLIVFTYKQVVKHLMTWWGQCRRIAI